jgi:thiol-disulfide isomerase/thioredoxin
MAVMSTLRRCAGVLLPFSMVVVSAAPVSRAMAQATGVVSGVVRSTDGQAIRDANVSLKTFVGGKMDSVSAPTDANGRFELQVAGHASASLEIGAPAKAWAWQRLVTPERDTLRFRVVLAPKQGTSRVILADTASDAARLIAAFQLSDSVMALAQQEGRVPDAAAMRAAMRGVVPRLLESWRQLRGRSLRVTLAHEILMRGADAVDSTQTMRFSAEFDPREPVWDELQYSASLYAVVARTNFPHLATDSVRRMRAFRTRFNRAIDSVLAIVDLRASVREDLLSFGAVAAAKIDRDTTRARRMLAVLEREFPGSSGLRRAREGVDDRRRLRVGQPIPPFTVLAMDDTVRRTLDLAKARHRYTLVDFWATWCTPCVADVPGIGRALARWRGAGLAVVSVSFDGTADKVKRFRRARHPMPWEHWMAIGIVDGVTARELEITGFPRTVLIDSSGRVVAEDGDLRGEQLAVTLTRLLGPGKARK